MRQGVKNYQRVNPEWLHDVRANAARLGVLYSVEVELTRLVGSWIPRMPELPEKLLLGRAAFDHADLAYRLQHRLIELRVGPDEVAAYRSRTARGFAVLERLVSPERFFSALFRVVEPALLGDLRRHVDSAPPYVDEPTLEFVRPAITAKAERIAAGLALLSERRTPAAVPEADLWGSLWNVDAEDGGLVQDGQVGSAVLPIPRPVWPAAVDQLPYEQAMPPYPQEFDAAMRRCIHELVFSEVEALDVFGHYLYQFADFPAEFQHEAARIAWDEARHVELLLNVLERYGGTVGEFPANAPGYEEYYRQEGILEKLIMVNVIAEGEVSTDTQTQHRDAFYQINDELSGILTDYEMADEIIHGRFGVKWAHWLADQTGADYQTAYANARAALDEFKSHHDDIGGDSPIPLLRLGVEETGPKRAFNEEAKRLVGFTDADIERMRTEASPPRRR